MTDAPLGSVTVAAVTMHEIYTSLQKAGFTKREAMELLKHQLLINAQSPNNPPQPPPNR